MSTETVALAIPYRTIKLPPRGTYLPHLAATFWAIGAAKPGSDVADHAILVPHGDEFERQQIAWGGYGVDEPGAACMWDGLANTRALIASKHEHPIADFCAEMNARTPDMPPLYVPALREIKALFGAGCDAFKPGRGYHTSTQFSRFYAFYQGFDDGNTLSISKSWQGGSARLVRRSSLESLIP